MLTSLIPGRHRRRAVPVPTRPPVRQASCVRVLPAPLDDLAEPAAAPPVGAGPGRLPPVVTPITRCPGASAGGHFPTGTDGACFYGCEGGR